jgi:hypothetical protein
MKPKPYGYAAALTTFLAGVAAVWLAVAFAALETKLADWLVPESSASVPAPPLVGREESDAQEVYATVLREMFGGGRADGRVVLAPSTADHRFNLFYDRPETSLPGVSAETLEDFSRKSYVESPLAPLRSLAASQVFLERREFQKLFARYEDGWKTFYDRYPNSAGFIDLSAVGFDYAGGEALLYVSRSCGRVCGDAWHVLLRKGPEGWRVEMKELVWAPGAPRAAR